MENNIIDENMTFTIANEQGVGVKCEVLADLTDEDTGKTYIVYTDYIYETDGSLNFYASEIVKNEAAFQLLEIHDEEINLKINEFMKELKIEVSSETQAQ